MRVPEGVAPQVNARGRTLTIQSSRIALGSELLGHWLRMRPRGERDCEVLGMA